MPDSRDVPKTPVVGGFTDFVEASGRRRLGNALRAAGAARKIPYETLEAYLAAPEEIRIQRLMKLPNLGKKSAGEFEELAVVYLEQIARNGSERASEGSPEALSVSATQGAPTDDGAEESTNDEDTSLFAALSDREFDVLCRRYGLEGRRKQTLEDVGDDLGVTRERIRQIQKKAVSRLRASPSWERWQTYLKKEEDWFLNQVFGSRTILFDAPRLSGMAALVADIAIDSLEDYLSIVCDVWEDHWIRPGANISQAGDALLNLEALLRSNPPLPVRLVDLSDEWGLPFSAVATAIAVQKELRVHRGYAFKGSKSARKKRLINILKMMDDGHVGHPARLWEIRVAYWSRYSADRCSGRDLQLVLADSPRHVMNLRELGWVRIRHDGTMCPTRVARATVPAEVEHELSREPIRSGDGLANRVYRLFEDGGPMRLTEVAQKFAETYPEYSRSSIYPTLVIFPVFVRLAPGILGIQNHTRDSDVIESARELLKADTQLDLYLLARLSSDPQISYPLWGPGMEFHWAQWLLAEQSHERLGQLLSIADIENWPISGRERQVWEGRRQALSSPPSAPTVRKFEERTVDFAMLETALVAASIMGKTNWMHLNQALGWRIETTRTVVVLGTLIHAGCLRPEGKWYETHFLTQHGRHVLTKMLEARVADMSIDPSLIDPNSAPGSEVGWASEYSAEELISKLAKNEDRESGAENASDGDELDALYDSILRQSIAGIHDDEEDVVD